MTTGTSVSVTASTAAHPESSTRSAKRFGGGWRNET